MNIISAEEIKGIKQGLKGNKDKVSGVIQLDMYEEKTAKTGTKYYQGTLENIEKISFKVWGGSDAATELETSDYRKTPVYIEGEVNEFNGNFSLVVRKVQAVSGYESSDFEKKIYDRVAYEQAFWNLLDSLLSEKGRETARKIFTYEVMESFTVEQAALSHHDNCASGLLAHTYKCLSLMNWVLQTYPQLQQSEELDYSQSDRKDLFVLSVVCHDLGKIREMNKGIYQNVSMVTHRFLGVEYLSKIKEELVSDYSELWYYNLVSVLLQHHGEYGDPCKTMAAQVVHYIDTLESQMTGLMQTDVMPGQDGARVRHNGTYLYV